MKFPHYFFFFLLLGATSLQAIGEIRIDQAEVERKGLNYYLLRGNVANTTSEIREVVLRAQISFYERSSPAGDKPAAVLMKDINLVLRPGESRSLEVVLQNEGMVPKGSLRMQPNLRIRRQREWNY